MLKYKDGKYDLCDFLYNGPSLEGGRKGDEYIPNEKNYVYRFSLRRKRNKNIQELQNQMKLFLFSCRKVYTGFLFIYLFFTYSFIILLLILMRNPRPLLLRFLVTLP